MHWMLRARAFVMAVPQNPLLDTMIPLSTDVSTHFR